MKTQAFAAIVATIALGVASASAQNTTAKGNAQANPAPTQPALTHPQEAPPPGKNAEIGTATIKPTGLPPSQRNPLLADTGDVRISKLIGSTIYNKDDQKVGSVDDVLAGPNGQLNVVISTSNKKTLVPWDRLVFGDAKLNSDNKVLMPDATRNQLDKMQAFNYQNTNNNKK
jgi:PRC-barrel domain